MLLLFSRSRFLVVLLWMVLPGDALLEAQQTPFVRIAESRSHRVDHSVEVTGTVESRLVSVVAGEVEGLVVEFPVREGRHVREGDVLARLRDDNLRWQLEAARAQLREDQARRRLAERTLERARGLYESGVFSRQQLDDAEFETEAWTGRTERLRAEIARLEDDIERSTVRAPFDGIVVAERTQRGEWIAVGDPVVELMSLKELEVGVDLPERYYGRVRNGTRARVTFEAVPGVEVPGVVNAVVPRGDAQARTFPVKLGIPSRDGMFGPGMMARVGFSFGTGRESVIVPRDAVMTRGTEQFLFVLEQDDTVRRVEVRPGTGVGAWVEVHGQVTAGLRVVTHGNERIVDGQRVRYEVQEYPAP